MTSPVAAHFSESYVEAREKFLAAVAEAGAVLLDSHRCPVDGPAGEPLHTDVARIGPANAEKLLILVSSTHGIEGYCGSGSQVGWLRARHYWRDAAPDTAVLLVHAINPYGFAWGRRVTQENVDLNRNFVDHAAPYPENPDYAALAGHINPREWTPAALAAADRAIADHYGLPNTDFLPKAVHGGQYINPLGTFFGGNAPTWSNQTFRRILRERAGEAREIALIDYHTGLGPTGYGDLIFGGRAEEGHARRWFDHVTPTEAELQEPGHKLGSIPGPLKGALLQELPDRQVTAGAIEYGTHPVSEVLQAIRADNWLYAHGDPDSPQGREIRAVVREMFYPSLWQWKVMVFSRSNDVIRQALAGLARA